MAKKKATVIAIANQKGGTAKTTTCENLGIGLAQQGKDVLLVDADPQGSLTIALGNQTPDEMEPTLSDMMERVIREEPILPCEGVLRLGIFLSYLALVRRVPDMKRGWMYHGAEHKTIFCYEAGLPLTVENARKQSRFHPRCGTSSLFLVIFVSILVFSLVRTEGTLARMGLHILLLPVVVSLSYEVIKWAGRHDNALTRIVSAPGKAIQHLTTAEQDDSMLEVAIEALTLVLPEEKGTDIW